MSNKGKRATTKAFRHVQKEKLKYSRMQDESYRDFGDTSNQAYNYNAKPL